MDVNIDTPVSFDPPDFFHQAVSPINGVLETRLLVGGKWQPAETGDTFEVRSPIDGSVVARAAKAASDDVESAIAAARDARADFRKMPAAERLEICAHAAEILGRHHDIFVDAIVVDLGKVRPGGLRGQGNTRAPRIGPRGGAQDLR